VRQAPLDCVKSKVPISIFKEQQFIFRIIVESKDIPAVVKFIYLEAQEIWSWVQERVFHRVDVGFSYIWLDSARNATARQSRGMAATHAEKDVQQVLINGLFRTFLLFRRRYVSGDAWLPLRHRRRANARWRTTFLVTRRATPFASTPRDATRLCGLLQLRSHRLSVYVGR